MNDHSHLALTPRQRKGIFDDLADVNSNIFPEYYLIEVQRFQNIIHSDLDEWIYFFKNSEIKKEFKSKNIQRAKEKLDVLKMSERERRAFQRYVMNLTRVQDMFETAIQDGIEEGIKKGEELGVHKKSIEMGKMVLANNEPLDKIKMYTGLSEQEIRELKTKK